MDQPLPFQGAPQIITQPKHSLRVEPGSRGNTLQIQATGNGLQYQWCKRVSGDTSSPETTSDTEIFHRYSRDFEQTVNVGTLCPALFRVRLITREQMEELVQEVPGNINTRKIKRLLLWLPTSSGQFVDRLIQCLREGEELGHWELADSLEKALWAPLSSQNVHYDGVNNSTLVLCSVRGEHEGLYCCRVTSSSDRSVLSGATRVELVKPDESAKEAFMSELQANPEKGAELAQTLISRLQPGSTVGYHALSRAIRSCGEVKEVVRAFLASGWSATERLAGEGGRTLVHLLAEEGHTGTLMLALPSCPTEKAAKTTDETRCTPLHLAVKAGRLQSVLALLEVKEVQATVNYQEKDFNTVLHLAVEQGSVEMVQALLLVPDINTGILNAENLKAVEVAQKKELDSIVKALEEKERRPWMSSMANGDIPLGPRSNSCKRSSTLCSDLIALCQMILTFTGRHLKSAVAMPAVSGHSHADVLLPGLSHCSY
jgi:hypothetical protein